MKFYSINYYNKNTKKILRFINKSPWFKAMIFLLIVLILFKFFFKNKKKENFVGNKKKIKIKKNKELYYDFYAKLYDEFLHDRVKNDFEFKSIKNKTTINENSKLLDIGSGTGQMVHLFNKDGIESEGIDYSPAMVKISKKKFPNYKFSESDALDPLIYSANTFTHITCFYFTLYYIENKEQFFENCYNWLEKDGYLIIHVVDREKFDPILDKANPITAVSVQKYAKERITTSTIKFGDFLYKAKFKLNKDYDKAKFTETMKHDESGNIRKNIHELFMEKKSEIIKMAKSYKFKLKEVIDLVHIGYEYQYLYILQKTD